MRRIWWPRVEPKLTEYASSPQPTLHPVLSDVLLELPQRQTPVRNGILLIDSHF